jgi:hypothetical protein
MLKCELLGVSTQYQIIIKGDSDMRLFTDESLDINEIDFTKCETLNGDFITIATTRPKLLEKYISIFEHYTEKYPNHVNYPIWKQYITVFEDSLLEQI